MGFFKKLFGNNNSNDKKVDLVKSAEMLDEDLYWLIINESLSNSMTQDDQKEYLINRLQKLTTPEIIGFKLRTEKLCFDTYNSELWCAGFIINEGCSDDSFEYFRYWVISRGREVFYRAKENPDNLISEIIDEIDYYDFQDFNQIPDKAFEARTFKDIHHYIDEVNFEKLVGRYSKIKFNWSEEDPNSMQEICPNLFVKMWK